MEKDRCVPYPENRAAMSLVEVVVALGILSFALIPIIGLLSHAMTQSRISQTDTVVASAAREIAGEFRYQPDAGTNALYFFTRDGARQTHRDAETVFACEAAITSRPENPKFREVTLTFRSPPDASGPQNEEVIHASFTVD